MAILDSQLPQFNSFDEFARSPQALALASSLLKSSGWQKEPVTLGQALGGGVDAMQAAGLQDLQKQALMTDLQSKQLLLEQARAKQAAGKKISSLLGSPAKNPEDVGLFMTPDAYKGRGYLGGELTPEQFRQQAAGVYAEADPEAALKLLTTKTTEYGTPKAVLDESGHPKLIMTDKQGNIREVPGYLPQPRAQTSLVIDPVTNQIMYTQGGAALPEGWLKDPKMGPARGGQGGTYTNPATGEVISTPTSRQAFMDQQTIASVGRVIPQIDRILKTLPQFQKVSQRGAAYLQGVSNSLLGTDYRLPSKLAEGKAALESAPEALLKAFGLNVTDQSMQMMQATVKPVQGESAEGYKHRIVEQLKEIKMFEDQSKGRLASGITLKEGNQPQTQQAAPQYTEQQLQTMAQQAIARGANPEQVKARMQQLRGG